MSDKAVIKGSSTLGESLKEVPTETVETATQPETQNTDTTETSSTAVGANGELETNIEVPETTMQGETVEDNVSDFDISFGSDFPQGDTQNVEQQPAPQTFTDWKDALKKADRKEILKELGITEFAAELSDFQRKGGKVTDYLLNKGINWEDVPDIDLVRADFDSKYSNLSKEEKAYLFNKKFVSNPDVDDDETIMSKRIELKTAASEIRQKKIAEQQSFKEPEIIQPEQDAEYAAWKEQQQQLTQSRETFKNFLNSHEATKSLLENKRVAIKVDDKGNSYNFGISKPEAILNALTDGGKTWMQLMQNAQGEPDIAKQQLVILFASNPEQFVGKIFQYGKMQGAKETVLGNSNTNPAPSGTPPRSNATITNERDVWKNARSSTLGAN